MQKRTKTKFISKLKYHCCRCW